MVANHTSIHGLNEANMAVAERMSGRLARERTRPFVGDDEGVDEMGETQDKTAQFYYLFPRAALSLGSGVIEARRALGAHSRESLGVVSGGVALRLGVSLPHQRSLQVRIRSLAQSAQRRSHGEGRLHRHPSREREGLRHGRLAVGQSGGDEARSGRVGARQ